MLHIATTLALPNQMSNESQSDASAAWRAYRERMDEWCRKAEEHMELAPGTITKIDSDPDYIGIIKIHAVIEPLLNEAMRNNVTRSFVHSKVNFPAGDAISKHILALSIDKKREISLSGEMITKKSSEFIYAISKLRNKYAHNIKNISKTTLSLTKELTKEDKGFVKKLLGTELEINDIAYALLGRELLVLNLGDFISQVMHIVSPPAFPPLGSLFGLGGEWKGDRSIQKLGSLPQGILGDPPSHAE